MNSHSLTACLMGTVLSSPEPIPTALAEDGLGACRLPHILRWAGSGDEGTESCWGGGGRGVLATVPNCTTAVDRGSPGLRTRPFASTVVALSRSVRRCGQRASERDHIRSLGWILVPSVGSGVHPAEQPGREGLSLGLGRERALLPDCGITRARLLQPHEQATRPGWGSHWKRRVLECRTPAPRAPTHLSPK